MDHHQIKEKLDEYYDGELGGSERAELESHLQSCVECRTTIEQWQKVAGVFFKSEPKFNSEFFVTRVMARLETESQPSPFGWARSFWRAGLATLSLAAVVWMLNSTPNGVPVSIETLLLADGRMADNSEWVFKDAVQTDDLLGYTLEEQ